MARTFAVGAVPQTLNGSLAILSGRFRAWRRLLALAQTRKKEKK